MTSTLDPDSADLTLLQDRQVAVLGFDSLAAAHALNLRDSGVDVWVGTAPDSRLAGRAEVEGLAVAAPEEAVRRCDIVLVPEMSHGEHAPDVLRSLVAGHTEEGDLVIVTGPSTVHEGGLVVPDGVDLAMLRTIGDGHRVREEYLDGRGCPALVAVERDGSGAAWATLTAYAAAMGSLRSGAVVTTIEHEARAMGVAQDRIHVPLQQALESAYEDLVGGGVEPEVAYVALVHDLKTRVDQIYASGFASQHGPAGQDRVEASASRRDAARSAHELEQAGRRVRAMTSWLR